MFHKYNTFLHRHRLFSKYILTYLLLSSLRMYIALLLTQYKGFSHYCGNQHVDADILGSHYTHRLSVLFCATFLCCFFTSIDAFGIGVAFANLYAFQRNDHWRNDHTCLYSTRSVSTY